MVVAVSSVVSLQEDSVEVPGLHVFIFTAPAGSSLQVDHDLLQLLLYHIDAGSDGEEDDQTAKISYYSLVSPVVRQIKTKHLHCEDEENHHH